MEYLGAITADKDLVTKEYVAANAGSGGVSTVFTVDVAPGDWNAGVYDWSLIGLTDSDDGYLGLNSSASMTQIVSAGKAKITITILPGIIRLSCNGVVPSQTLPIVFIKWADMTESSGAVKGTASIDFGTTISNYVEVTVSDTNVKTDSVITVVLQGSTADHNELEHAIIPVKLTTKDIVDATSFKIVAYSEIELTGTFSASYIIN